MIILLSPLIAITYLVIIVKLGRPAIFVQMRPGRDEKPFNVYKFRSMKEAYDLNGVLLPDEERMTAVGSVIRKLSLDELPQLF